MTDTQLPGVFGDVQPLLEHYGYLAVGGFVLLEDFGLPVPGEALLIAAAGFAGSGNMNIALVILVAVIGAIGGTSRSTRRSNATSHTSSPLSSWPSQFWLPAASGDAPPQALSTL